MFSHQAHTFRQQARLSITLSWIAGYTNILTILTCGQVTSHVSGTASQLGRDVVEGRWHAGGYMVALLTAFAGGAGISGVLTELGRHRRWSSIYVLPMVVECVLLALFAVLIDWNVLGDLHQETAALWLTLLPSLAMGLQNATITRISGGVVRTTHVTGVLTDLGHEAAIWTLRRREAGRTPASPGTFASGWRLLLLASIVSSFALGAALGTLAFDHFPRWSMVPALAFLLWIVGVDVLQPIASTRSNKDVGGDLHAALPPGVSVFHITSEASRFGRRVRMPDMAAWADRLEDGVRVVVLDVAGVETLDADGFVELQALARRLVGRGRALVLAGVTRERYARLRDHGVLEAVDATNVCSDLELAAAHAIHLLDEQTAGA